MQFAAYGRKKNGDSVPVSVTYSATGGTISAAGLYTAGQTTGPYHVIARQSSGTLADTAAVAISDVPVASVTVSPTSASPMVGATTQLTATPKDSNGTALSGRAVTWASNNAAAATVSPSGLVTGVVTGSATITATSEGKNGTAAITVTAPVIVNPGTVTDLAVVGVADTGVTLAFTEVNDGTGLPASYNVRYQVGTITWGSTATSVTRGTCASPLAGTAIGAKRTCTVLGLTPATAYQVQLVAFRGTLNLNAVFGGLSNITGATTAPSTTSTDSGPQPGPTSTILMQDGFESGNLNSWTQDPAAGRYSLSTDPTRVHSGNSSLQALYTPTNGYGLITRWFQAGFENMRNDGNGMHFFTLCGNNVNNNKSCWGQPGVVPNGTDFFYAGLDPAYVQWDPTLRPFSFYTYWPDMSCCYGNLFFQSPPQIALGGGQWQEVVFHIKLNTIGQSDGSQDLWINGVKVISGQNMRWRTTTDLRLNEIIFFNYMPGGLQTQDVWVDDLTVWRP